MPQLTRRLLYVILLVLAVAAISYAVLKQQSTGRVRLELFHIWSGLRLNHVTDALNAFSQTHPEIEVHSNTVNTAWARPYLMDASKNGYLTDVVMVNAGWVNDINSAQTMMDLKPFLDADNINIDNLIPENELESGRSGNAIYLLPFSARSTSALLYINENLTAKAGLAGEALELKTWDQFIEVSKRLVEKLNAPGELETIAWNPLLDRGIPTVALLGKSLGADTQSADGRFAMLDSLEMEPAWQAIDRYVTEVYGSRGGFRALLEWRNRYGGFASNTAFLPFAHGRCAFSIGGLWAFGIHAKITPKLAQAVRPIPGINDRIPLFRSNTWLLGISKNTPNPQAAWKLLRFLTLEEEGNRKLNLAFGLIPAVTKYQDPEPYLKLYGPRWNQVIPYQSNQNTPVVEFNADYIEPINISLLTNRAIGLPLDEVIGRMQAEMQGYIEASQPQEARR